MMDRAVMGKCEDSAEEFRESLTRRERKVRWMGEVVKKVENFVNVHDVRGNGCIQLVSVFANGRIVTFCM
jgi:hypothetical protein